MAHPAALRGACPLLRGKPRTPRSLCGGTVSGQCWSSAFNVVTKCEVLGEGILSPSPSTEPREWCAPSRTPFAWLGPLAHLPLASCVPAPVTLCPRTRPGYRLAGALSPAGGPFCLSARPLRGPSHPGLQLTALKPCPHPLPGHGSCTEARRRQSLARGKRRGTGGILEVGIVPGLPEIQGGGGNSQKCCKTLAIRWPANAFISKKTEGVGVPWDRSRAGVGSESFWGQEVFKADIHKIPASRDQRSAPCAPGLDHV